MKREYDSSDDTGDLTTSSDDSSNDSSSEGKASPKSNYQSAAAKEKDWRDKAGALLQQRRPKMIVIDLDNTVWPDFSIEATSPPYIFLSAASSSPKADSNGAGNGGIKLLCKDRFTNLPTILILYPEILDVLLFCRAENMPLSICSRTSQPETVKAILQSLRVWDYFSFPQLFPARKTVHFRNLQSITGLQYSDMLFFDDEYKNIDICTSLGVSSCLVDRNSGLDGITLVKGLRSYVAKDAILFKLPSYIIAAKRNKQNLIAQLAETEDSSDILV